MKAESAVKAMTGLVVLEVLVQVLIGIVIAGRTRADKLAVHIESDQASVEGNTSGDRQLR